MLEVLADVKAAHDKPTGALSWADLIVLAGNVALEDASKLKYVPFCGGRVDALEGGSKWLAPRVYLKGPVVEFKDNAKVR